MIRWIFSLVLLIGPLGAVNAQRLPTEDLSRWTFEAIRRKESGDRKGAIALYEKIIAKDNTHYAAHYSVAELYALDGEYKKALDRAHRAVRIDPTNLWGWRLERSLHLEAGNWQSFFFATDSLVARGDQDPALCFESAAVAQEQGEIHVAVRFVEAAEKATGRTPEGTQFLTQLLLSTDPERVLRIQKETLLVCPEPLEMLGMHASTLLQLHRYAEAKSVFQKALRDFPNDGRAHLGLSSAYESLQQHDSAAMHRVFAMEEPALDIDQKIKMVLSLLTSKEALNLVNALRTTHPENPKGWALSADVYSHRNRMEEARGFWRTALRLPGGDLWLIHQSLLVADAEAKAYAEWESDALYAVESYPLKAAAYFHWGMALQGQKKWKEALSAYTSGLPYSLSVPELHFQLYTQIAEVHHRLGDPQASNEAFEYILSKQPTFLPALNNYAYFLAVRGERVDYALVLMQRVLAECQKRQSPISYEYLDTLAYVLYKNGDLPQAWVAMERCLAAGGAQDAGVVEHQQAIERALKAKGL